MKQAVRKNVAIFIRKHLCWRLFNKSAGLTATLVKGETSTGVFLLIFPAILKNLWERLLLRSM